jgi:SNF2 family DNA or RNA helicase
MDQMLKTHPGQRGLYVVPASLVNNVYKEMDKHGMKHLKKRVDVLSYEKASRMPEELAAKHYAMTVFDEAHRLRNSGSQRTENLRQVADTSDKVLMLTGTAGYNHPADVASLVNIINPEEYLPADNKRFEQAYINNQTWRFKQPHILAKTLNKYIDKYDRPVSDADYPKVYRRVVPVEMSPNQAEMYKVVERSIPIEIRAKLKSGLPMTLQEATKLNIFSTGVRQVSDSQLHHNIYADFHDNPKIMTAADRMYRMSRSVPGFRGVMYSNYIDAGINPYVQALRERGLTPLVYTGGLNKAEKQRLVDTYNAPGKDPQVLVISSSGGEGLDLKNTRMMQILEPHFNQSKINQVEARAVRYKSHDDLPPDQRKVLIEEYRSRFPVTFMQKLTGNRTVGIDDYLSLLAARKQQMINQMNGMLITHDPEAGAYPAVPVVPQQQGVKQ